MAERSTRGILLAGGSGSRLWPTTRAISKHLLPVYDKPMINYPLSVLMLSGVRDITLISTPHDLPLYRRLLGDGTQFGLRLTYTEQVKPAGIAEAIKLADSKERAQTTMLILGDNIFHGAGLQGMVQEAINANVGATIFGYWVKDPSRYGVAELDPAGNVLSVEEKPARPKSHYAIPGLYIYNSSCYDFVQTVRPSARGELEITDLNAEYLRRRQLRVVKFPRGMAWLDTGTHESLLEASSYVAAVQHRQGLQIACLEEVAFRMGFIDSPQLLALSRSYKNPDLEDYLASLASGGA